MTDISKRMEISLPTVSVAFQKGERLIRDERWGLEEYFNINI
jgi:hypothetical protein